MTAEIQTDILCALFSNSVQISWYLPLTGGSCKEIHREHHADASKQIIAAQCLSQAHMNE